MIYDAAKVGSVSIYYGAYSGSSQSIDTMSLCDFGNTRVDYTPMYNEVRIGYFDISRAGVLRWFLPMKATIDLLVLARVYDVRWFLPMEAVIDLLDFAHEARLRFY